MGGWNWENARRLLANPQWPWMLLWLCLAVVTVALVILLRTSWGQSHPLRKCVALSLLIHLLVAGYATTVQIVTATAGSPDGGPIGLVLFDDPNSVAGNGEIIGEPTEPDQPWDNFGGSSQPVLDATESPLPRPDTASAAKRPTPRRSHPARERIPLASPDTEVAHPNPIPFRGGSSRKPAAIGEPFAEPDENPGPAESSSNQSPTEATGGTATNGASTEANESPAGNPGSEQGSDDGAADGASNGSTAGAAAAGPVSVRSDLPDLYRDRVAGDRIGVARRHGGSHETEAAVQAALNWLAENQSADGRWDADKHGAGRENAVLGHDRRGAGAKADTGMTGLALLAFLGAGYTHRGGPHSKTVARGLEFLLDAQASDGNLGGAAELYAFMYCHGMATFALSEAYAISGDRRLEPPLRAAIGYTLATQNPTTGGWRYQPHETGDTSQLGWQLMALKSAELAGVPMPEATREGAVRFLKSVAGGPNGGLASYRPRERMSRPMTAEALVCRQFLGMSRDNPAADEAGDYLLGELPGGDRINLYYWYYATIGMYQLQGDHWRQWNDSLRPVLVGRQIVVGELAGSWDPDCIWGGYGGRVYSTALAALCLEVYYRYLPLYKHAEVAGRPPR